jgi:hypothetical protein
MTAAMGVFASYPALFKALLAWAPVPGISTFAQVASLVIFVTPSPTPVNRCFLPGISGLVCPRDSGNLLSVLEVWGVSSKVTLSFDSYLCLI